MAAGNCAEQFLNDLQTFCLDRPEGQPVHLVIAVEAAGMLPQVERVATDYGPDALEITKWMPARRI